MKYVLSLFLFAFILSAGGRADAQTCGGTYTVQPGDSLSVIADRLYKNAGMWSVIHRDNIAAIGQSPNAIAVGMRLNLTCIDGLPVGLEGGREVAAVDTSVVTPVTVQPGTAAVRNRINLLTGGDYAPFTDKDWHNGGLITDIVDQALRKANPSQGFAIHWVNDWGSHFDPLLSNALLDMGFPWYLPDCNLTPDIMRCRDFLASESMFETLMLVFANKANPIRFDSDEDIIGKTICRPVGFLTFDLDGEGRRWILDDKVKLVTPQTVADCFRMVAEGEADFLSLSEFIGRAAMKDLGYEDRITVLPRPLSIVGIHVFVHKTHPQAEELLDLINTGLRGIREDGLYQTIVEDHMTRIWANL
ncbi:Peptidoglycan-binding LysM [Roseobacter sp. AzwK-3b]|uniref:transporter substrate-binding domain-containing protein n=1 Tax=Roseobacter sp. AzwK-3b TaxID=351016 RepID=UPI0001568E17|nr:transporter substrate-binding domain-containing protein [Roseobacter sp. AzwK-3b]EDM72875.1 Peptidoglycan-binding LysM [Roseobacter sp. AzwK-3b]